MASGIVQSVSLVPLMFLLHVIGVFIVVRKEASFFFADGSLSLTKGEATQGLMTPKLGPKNGRSSSLLNKSCGLCHKYVLSTWKAEVLN